MKKIRNYLLMVLAAQTLYGAAEDDKAVAQPLPQRYGTASTALNNRLTAEQQKRRADRLQKALASADLDEAEEARRRNSNRSMGRYGAILEY